MGLIWGLLTFDGGSQWCERTSELVGGYGWWLVVQRGVENNLDWVAIFVGGVPKQRRNRVMGCCGGPVGERWW